MVVVVNNLLILSLSTHLPRGRAVRAVRRLNERRW